MAKPNKNENSKNENTNEMKKLILKELIEKGKSKGILTYKEVIAAFAEVEISPEHIEKVYETFETLGIELVGQSFKH